MKAVRHINNIGEAGEFALSSGFVVRMDTMVPEKSSSAEMQFGNNCNSVLRHEIEHFKKERPDQKPRAAKRVADIIRLDSSSIQMARRLKRAVQMLLSSDYSERFEDATELLCGLGAPTVVVLTKQDLPSSDCADFWHVLVRALGRLKQRETVLRFKDTPIVAVREAVVEALDDIGDSESRSAIEEIRKSDPSEFVQRLAAEYLSE